MLNIKSDNKNYLARIVKLGEPRAVPNADRLKSFVVNGCSVISGLEAKKGMLYCYFALESALNKEFLSFTNSFENKELNADQTVRGFFSGNSGRVKAVRLRGQVSEGYICPVSSLETWLKSKGVKLSIDDSFIDCNFDHIGDIKICEKYVVPIKNTSLGGNRANKKVKRESKIVENQFRLSLDAEHLKRNLHKVSPEDLVTISYKLHGCVKFDTLISTKEHGDIYIKDIVDKKLKVSVKCFDFVKDEIIYSKVSNHFIEKESGLWLEIELENGELISVTDNHLFWVEDLKCYRAAGNLRIGDKLSSIR